MKIKRRYPIFFYIQYVRDILAVFFFCLGLVCLITPNKKEKEILTFNQSFQPSLIAPAQSKRGVNTRTGSALPEAAAPRKKEIVHLRTFKWIDPAQKNRVTTLSIFDADLRREIKKFGKPYFMTNPLLLERRGFKVIGRRDFLRDKQVRERVYAMVDYKGIFKRNLTYFPSLTRTIMESAEILTNTDPMHALLCFVQHIRYEQPPKNYKGKFIGEFFVPLVCLYEQYGDCDSKALLLAEFLVGVPNSKEKVGMVLVRGNGLSHALLGVRAGFGRKILPGMTAIFIEGKGYYLVLETTQPKWAPGFIGGRIFDALKTGSFQFVELN